jgi:hypothetical protein
MKCEVAVFNRRGIALAAAASEQIFQISPRVPIAILAPAGTMMDVPWQTIVETYIHERNERAFASMDECARHFLDFLQNSTTLFPAQTQAECFRRCVRSVWADYRDRLETAGDSLDRILAEDRRELLSTPNLPGFDDAFGKHVVDAYASELEAIEADVFVGVKLTRSLRVELRAIVALKYGKDWCHPAEDNCIAFAGMGNDEPFPSILTYAIGTVVAGRLRYVPRHAVRIGPGCDAGVVPLGDREAIDTVIEGIHPDVLAMVRELRPHVLEYHSSPFMASIAALSRGGLARMARALVTVSSIDAPVDVALLVKGAGFARERRDVLGVR